MKQPHHFLSLVIVVLLLLLGAIYLRRAIGSAPGGQVGLENTADRLKQYGEIARDRLKPYFERTGIVYPPARVTLVGLKEERTLQVYASDGGGTWRFVRSYPILGASGGAGPKLREGDYQVPEGIYPIDFLNPNSTYHLSMRIGYPNIFDRQQAAQEGRTNLGGDIMIHGSVGSVGCLAMGDETSEDLFVLAADTGVRNLSVILAPVDFREGKTVPPSVKLPAWTKMLYPQIKARLAELPPAKE